MRTFEEAVAECMAATSQRHRAELEHKVRITYQRTGKDISVQANELKFYTEFRNRLWRLGDVVECLWRAIDAKKKPLKLYAARDVLVRLVAKCEAEKTPLTAALVEEALRVYRDGPKKYVDRHIGNVRRNRFDEAEAEATELLAGINDAATRAEFMRDLQQGLRAVWGLFANRVRRQEEFAAGMLIMLAPSVDKVEAACALLGVPHPAFGMPIDSTKIDAQLRRLAIKHHPDVVAGDPEREAAAAENFILVQEAAEALRKYNATLTRKVAS